MTILALILALGGAAALFGVGTLGRKFFFRLLPAAFQFRRDLQEMRDHLDSLNLNLQSLEVSDLEVLSSRMTRLKNKGWMDKNHYGLFTSIFHEPFVATAWKSYPGPKPIFAGMVRFRDRTYWFRHQDGKCDLIMGEKHILGLQGEQILDPRGRPLGQFLTEGLQTRVILGGKERWQIHHADDAEQGPLPRALPYPGKVDARDLDLLLPLLAWGLVKFQLH